MQARQVVTTDLRAMKEAGERIAALTAYDYASAQIVDRAGLPAILVGDTLGMVVLGHPTTLPVTLDAMCHHAAAVVRGAKRALVIADLPFLTYQVSAESALRSAGRLLREAGCRAVKLEGGREVAATVHRLVSAGIPVCGHLGYTPQSAHRIGRPRMQARTLEQAREILHDALELEAAGAFAVVLELVPATVAAAISQRLAIPTIGIGSGPHCDGEIQVFHDIFGLHTDFMPRHTRRYLSIAEDAIAAATTYADDVRTRRFPGPDQCVDLPANACNSVLRALMSEEPDVRPEGVPQ